MSWNWTIHHWIHFHFGWINHLLEKSKTIHCCATNHWGLIHCAYWLYQTLHEVLENAISNISKTFSHIQDTPTPPKAIQQKKWCDLSLWRIHHRQQIKNTSRFNITASENPFKNITYGPTWYTPNSYLVIFSPNTCQRKCTKDGVCWSEA